MYLFFSLWNEWRFFFFCFVFRVMEDGMMLRLHPLWSPLQKALVVCTLIPRTDLLIDMAPSQAVDNQSQNYKTTDWPIRDTENRLSQIIQKHPHGIIHSTFPQCFGSWTFLSRNISPLQFLTNKLSSNHIKPVCFVSFIIWSVQAQNVWVIRVFPLLLSLLPVITPLHCANQLSAKL